MNFLGHLYFSNNDLELMHANLFGDFVRGKDLDSYKPFVREGILLHRQIDSYIDNHPVIKELLHLLYPDLPKIAGIAIDLYFDHLLAKNWNKFHNQSLNDFTNAFYNHSIKEENYPNEMFHFVLMRLKQGKWLNQYEEMEGLNRACQGVSRRISFPNMLKYAGNVYVHHEVKITETFYDFMDEAIPYFKAYNNEVKFLNK